MDCDSGSSQQLVLTINRSNETYNIVNQDFVVVSFTIAGNEDFAQRFEKVAEILSSNDRILLAKVDANREKALAAKYGIRSYPTIIIFKNGGKDVVEYDGPLLDAQAIADRLKRMSGYFHYKKRKFTEDDTDLTMFESLIDIEYTVDPRGLVAQVFGEIDKSKRKFTEDDTDLTMVESVIEYHVDQPRHVANFFGDIDKSKAILFLNRCDVNVPYFTRKYREVAEKHRGKDISFMLGYIEDSQDAFLFFKLHKGSKAPLIAIRAPGGKCYSNAELTSKDDIETFVENYLVGKLSIPQEQVGPVKEVGAQNFQKMVIDSGKNVFLVVGPVCQWCECCKKLAVVLETVAKRYEKDSSVLIAKLPDNDNGIKGLGDDPYAVVNRPALHFKRASGNELTLYLGLRTETHIINFIEANKDKVTMLKAVEKIKSLEDIDNLIRHEKIVVVGVFPKFYGEKYDKFREVADMLKAGYEFRSSDPLDLADGGDCDPIVRLYNPFISESKEKPFETKDFDVYALMNFVKAATSPVITLYDKHPQVLVDNFFYEHNDGAAKAMLFINRNGQDADTLMSKYTEVAKKYKGNEIIFMLGDIHASKNAFRYFDLESSEEPLLVILTSNRHRYVKERLNDNDDIESLVKDYKDVEIDELIEFVDEKYLSQSESNMDIDVANSIAHSDKAMLFINRREGALSLETKYNDVSKNFEGQGIKFMSGELADIESVFIYFEFKESVIVITNSKGEVAVREWLNVDDDIQGWVKDYKEGNVAKYKIAIRQPHLVITVTSCLEVQHTLMDPGKNVLLVLEGYKWNDSGKLSSLLSNVALHFSNGKDLLVATMDWDYVIHDIGVRYALTPVLHYQTTLSDFDPPTVYFIKKDGAEVYGGDINEEKMIEFVYDSMKKETLSYKLNNDWENMDRACIC